MATGGLLRNVKQRSGKSWSQMLFKVITLVAVIVTIYDGSGIGVI